MARASRKSDSDSAWLDPRDMIAGVKRAWGESPFYQAQLKGPAPDRLFFQPKDPRAPEKDVAISIARGRIAIGAESIDCEGDLGIIWDLAEPNGAMQTYLQEFSWLRHLEALGDEGGQVARQFMTAWLERYEKWSADEWRPYFVSERLVQICCHHPLILSRADALWRSRVLNSMARQTRHLARSAHRAAGGFDRLMTSIGLAMAGFCLPGCESAAERGLEMTRRELRLQLRPDGSHISRNPSRQLKLALRLQMLVQTIEARGIQPPPYLRHMLIRASAMSVFFRCADGRLAVFNGGYEDDGKTILSVQKAIDPDTAPTDFARHSGYHKLTAARALLILDTAMDTGAAVAFKSAGSFHFSSGRSRIITNCGNGAHRANEWKSAMQKRAAHSALSFDGVAGQPEFGEIIRRRAEDSAGQLIEFEREVFTARTDNARYIRRFFLTSNGADLRGEEILEEFPTDIAERATWRFHLHPTVRASLARDRRSVLLLLPNKEGWRFKSNCSEITLEKTVYCGEGAAPQSSEQIVVSAQMAPEREEFRRVIKWALKRVDGV